MTLQIVYEIIISFNLFNYILLDYSSFTIIDSSNLLIITKRSKKSLFYFEKVYGVCEKSFSVSELRRQTGKKSHLLSKRLASLGIMGARVRAPLKFLNRIVL